MSFRWWHAAALALVVVAVTSPSSPTSPRGAGAPARRVLLVGDSLAVGLGPAARADGATVTAKGGTVARQWISRGWFAAALEAARPELVLVSLGTNDATGQIDAGTFAAQAAQLEQLARARGARLVWLFPPPMPFSLDAIRAGLSRAEIDVLEPPAGLSRSSDRIHLTPAGYAAWWRAVAPSAFGVLLALATKGFAWMQQGDIKALWTPTPARAGAAQVAYFLPVVEHGHEETLNASVGARA